MLAIRLARVGAKKKPAYRVVVIDKRRARDSRSVEIVGHYNPTKDPIELALKDERIQYWMSKGAQASDTVRRLMAHKAKQQTPAEQEPPATEEQQEQPSDASDAADLAQPESS